MDCLEAHRKRSARSVFRHDEAEDPGPSTVVGRSKIKHTKTPETYRLSIANGRILLCTFTGGRLHKPFSCSIILVFFLTRDHSLKEPLEPRLQIFLEHFLTSCFLEEFRSTPRLGNILRLFFLPHPPMSSRTSPLDLNLADELMEQDIADMQLGLPEHHPLLDLKTESCDALQESFNQLGALHEEIENLKFRLTECKKRKKSEEMKFNALKKRKLDCDKAELIEQAKNVRKDNAQLEKTLKKIQNEHVDGECDQIKTRGKKCTSRRIHQVVDGKNFCKDCLLFHLKRYYQHLCSFSIL